MKFIYIFNIYIELKCPLRREAFKTQVPLYAFLLQEKGDK